MPNWCSNSVKFTGSEDALEKLRQVLTDKRVGIAQGYTYDMGVRKYFDAVTTGHTEGGASRPCYLFGRLLSSADFREEDIDADGAFHELSRYIGTKWDPSYDVHDGAPGHVSITFESAWAPPLAGLRVVARTYGVSAETIYEEPGMAFGGIQRIDSKGEIELDACGPYDELAYAIHGEDVLECELEEGILTEKDLEEFPETIDEFIERYER
jgi:hypothetical protein